MSSWWPDGAGGNGGSIPVGTGANTSTLTSRSVTSYPVPIFRPAAGSGSNLALDLSPTHGATDNAANGITWIDLCNDDPDVTANFNSLRVASWSDHVEIGGRNFGTASSQPIYFTINKSQNLCLFTNGQVGIYAGSGYGSGSPVGNNAAYVGLTVSNVSTGTSARSELQVVSDSAVGALRAWSAANSSTSFQSAVQLDGSKSGGLVLTASDANGSVSILAGGTTFSTKRSAQFDKSGNVFLGVQAALATNATNGFLSIPSMAGAPSGTPTTATGLVPIVYDTTDNKLYVYNGGWKAVTLA